MLRGRAEMVAKRSADTSASAEGLEVAKSCLPGLLRTAEKWCFARDPCEKALRRHGGGARVLLAGDCKADPVVDEVQEEPFAEDAVATQRRCWVRNPIDRTAAA